MFKNQEHNSSSQFQKQSVLKPLGHPIVFKTSPNLIVGHVVEGFQNISLNDRELLAVQLGFFKANAQGLGDFSNLVALSEPTGLPMQGNRHFLHEQNQDRTVQLLNT
jgi:hypothetical protein